MTDDEFSGVFRFHRNKKYTYVGTKYNNMYTTYLCLYLYILIL